MFTEKFEKILSNKIQAAEECGDITGLDKLLRIRRTWKACMNPEASAEMNQWVADQLKGIREGR